MRRILWVFIILMVVVVVGVQVAKRLPSQSWLATLLQTPLPTLSKLAPDGMMCPARIVISPDGKWIAVLYRGYSEIARHIHDHGASLTLMSFRGEKEYSLSFREMYFRLAAHIMRKGYPFVRYTFSPDKSIVATFGGDDIRVAIWDTRSKGLLAVLEQHSSPVTQVAVSNNGNVAVVGTEGGVAYGWNVTKRELLCRMRAHGGKVTAVAISSDSTLLATAGDDARLKVWKMRTGRLLWQSHRLHEPIVALAFSPDGNYLLSSTEDGETVLWEAMRGKPKQRIEWIWQTKGRTLSAGFRDKSAWIALEQEYICLWNLTESKLQGALGEIGASVHSLTFTPDGQHLLAGDEEGNIHIWRTATMDKEAVIRAGRVCVTALATSNDGKYVLAGSADGKVRMWDWGNRQPISLRCAPSVGRVQYVAFMPDGRRFIAASADGEVVVCDIHGTEIARVNNHGELQIAALSRDGSMLATQKSERTVVWRITNHNIQPLVELPAYRLAHTLAFSPDSSRLYVGMTGQVDAYRLRDGTRVTSRDNAQRWSFYNALSPDHDVVVDGVSNTAVELTSLRRGRLIARLEYVGGDIGWLIASADGYYTGSEKAPSYISWTIGDSIAPDLKRDPLAYYRPDAVRRTLRKVYETKRH